MIIAIYNRVLNETDLPIFDYLIQLFIENSITPLIFEPLFIQLKQKINLSDNILTFSDTIPLHPKTKYVFSMGGDGTMLDVVSFVAQRRIPILGINLGHLGFLSSTPIEDLAFVIQSLIKENHQIESRSLIHLDSNKPLFTNAPFALNEFTIQRKDSSSLIKIHTFINGEFLCTYWADGLIVSTPTGSTGYSLSCGGPIIFPEASSLVITPVAPHNLSVRPIIVADSSIISFEIEGRASQFLCTLDSRAETIGSDIALAVRKEEFPIYLVRLEGQNFLNTLKSKLFWGVDKRN